MKFDDLQSFQKYDFSNMVYAEIFNANASCSVKSVTVSGAETSPVFIDMSIIDSSKI